MTTQLCPVAKAAGEIQGNFDYAEGAAIKIGGSDTSAEYICDELTFYIAIRKLTLARFELRGPDLAECKQFGAKTFQWAGLTYSAIYTKIIDLALKKTFLYNQFVGLIDIIGQLEQHINARIDAYAAQKKDINVSIPDIFLLPHVDILILYRPDILAATVNKIVSYINKINISALSSAEPVQIDISAAPVFTPAAVPLMTTMIPTAVNLTTPAEYLASFRAMLAHELIVAEYIREIEKYHCAVINHLNTIYDICKKLIMGLLQ